MLAAAGQFSWSGSSRRCCGGGPATLLAALRFGPVHIATCFFRAPSTLYVLPQAAHSPAVAASRRVALAGRTTLRQASRIAASVLRSFSSSAASL